MRHFPFSNIVWLLPLALISIAWPLAQLPAMEYGSFREFTLHNSDKGPLKKDVILVFHGFGSAMPNGTYKALYKAFGEPFSVVGVNYDYLDVQADLTEFEDLWQDFLKGHKVTAVGTSLGGFWANYFANRYELEKVVLVNPAVDPTQDLVQFQGAQFSEKRQKDFHVTQAQIQAYGQVPKFKSPNTQRLVILTRDDPIIDFRNALEKYGPDPNSSLLIFDEGGHSPSVGDDRIITVIRAFIED